MEDRAWWTLSGACAGLFLLMLDSAVVSLALTEIERDLDASAEGIQWVMNGYLLTIAALVVTAGRLGDMYGRKRVYLIGVVAFTIGSVVSGAAGSEEAIVAGRVLQGIGAAAMLSLSLAIVSAAFPPQRQATALGIWTAVSSVALALGPLVGGLLVEADWRLIFWMNLPVCVAGFAITSWATTETRDESATHQLDRAGLLTLTAGLVALVLALVQADGWGWVDARTIGLLAGGIALLAAFVRVERRARQPIVDLELFRNRPYFGASAAAFALVAAWWVVIFFEPQYLQRTLGYSALEAGLLILPITMPMVVISPFAGALIARFGARGLMGTGMVLSAAGLFLMTRITDSSGYGVLLPGFLLFGLALGLVYAPMSNAAMAAMPRGKAGIAAGVLAMNRVLAGAVSLAVCGAIFRALEHEGFAHALASSLWVLVVLNVIGTALTFRYVESEPREARPAGLHHHGFHH